MTIMTPSTLEIKAAIQIQKTPAVVFEAIVDPVKMSGYFISKGSGRMEEGWANFLACLKASLDHGVNLRKGAFDYLKK